MVETITGSVLLPIWHVFMAVAPSAMALALAFTAIQAVATPCNPGMPWWRKPDLVSDFLFMFALPFFAGFARVAFLAVAAVYVYSLKQPEEIERFFAGGFGPLAGLNFWAQVAVYVIGVDLILYCTHRLFHSMALWRYHAIHHAPEHLDWTSATRFHPVNVIFHGVLADCTMLSLGIAPEVLAWLAPFNVAMSAFVHANLDWTLGPFRYVIASPVFHRWHHT
ncbi:MAG: sterol desaturase family protein, partial [Methylobacteriaceae bacterium]|nr:sterol desaturase family protein [Methylobacteriaceae bacterium]